MLFFCRDTPLAGLGSPSGQKQKLIIGLILGGRAREHEALMAKNMMSNHTDMQDRYCGDCYDIHPIQVQSTKVAAVGRHNKRCGAAFRRATSFVVSFVLGLKRVNIVAVTTILVLRVGVIGHHVPRHSGFMFLCRSGSARLRVRGVWGFLPLSQGVWGRLRPSQGSRGLWGGARRPNDQRD